MEFHRPKIIKLRGLCFSIFFLNFRWDCTVSHSNLTTLAMNFSLVKVQQYVRMLANNYALILLSAKKRYSFVLQVTFTQYVMLLTAKNGRSTITQLNL